MRSIISLSMCIVLVLFFFILIIRNAVDIPNGDDLYCLLLFTQKFQDSSSWVERFKLLTEQWVEHRIVYSRITALVSYWLTGQVNFVTIIIIGNLTLVGFTVLFWKVIQKTGASLLYLLPVILTLFSPVTYEANLWAGASTVYMPVGFLGLLTIYLLVYRTSGELNLILPLLTALLATYSFGNGMFTFIAGMAVLIYQRRHRAAIAWALVGICAVVCYFQSFQARSSTNAFSIEDHFREPIYLLYNLLGFVGGILDYSENVNSVIIVENIPSIVLGFLLFSFISGCCLLFFRRKLSGDLKRVSELKTVWFGMAVFILVTAVAMAYARTSGKGMNTMASRYKIYSMIFWIMGYLACLIKIKNKKPVGLLFGVMSFFVLLFNYYAHYDKLTNYKSSLLSGLFNYNKNGEWLIYWHTSYYEGASKILSDSVARNLDPVYTFRSVFPQLTYHTILNAPILMNVRMSTDRDCHGHRGHCLTLQTGEWPSILNHFKGIYLVVYSEENMYLFAADPLRNGRVSMLIRGSYFKRGFYLDKNFGDLLKKGVQYKLAIFCPTEKDQIKLLPYSLTG